MVVGPRVRVPLLGTEIKIFLVAAGPVIPSFVYSDAAFAALIVALAPERSVPA
jgi:hypothetical protein